MKVEDSGFSGPSLLEAISPTRIPNFAGPLVSLATLVIFLWCFGPLFAGPGREPLVQFFSLSLIEFILPEGLVRAPGPEQLKDSHFIKNFRPSGSKKTPSPLEG